MSDPFFFKGIDKPLTVPELTAFISCFLNRLDPPAKYDINVIGSRTELVLRVNVYTEKLVMELRMWTRDLYYDFPAEINAQLLVNELFGFYMELKTLPLRDVMVNEPPSRRLSDAAVIYNETRQEEGRTRKIEIENVNWD